MQQKQYERTQNKKRLRREDSYCELNRKTFVSRWMDFLECWWRGWYGEEGWGIHGGMAKFKWWSYSWRLYQVDVTLCLKCQKKILHTFLLQFNKCSVRWMFIIGHYLSGLAPLQWSYSVCSVCQASHVWMLCCCYFVAPRCYSQQQCV